MSSEGMGNTDMHDHRCSPTAFRVICCIASIFVWAIAAHAQQAHWSPFWDAVAARPGVKVVDGIDYKGREIRRIEFSSGVLFDLTREGNEITSFGSDTSGHGAVQCSWELYLGARSYVEACLPGEDPGFEARLDSALDRINDFIVENSLVPTAKSQLQEAVEQRKRLAREEVRGLSDDDRRKKCEVHAMRPLIDRMKSVPHDAWVAGLDKSLSVKRPPVMNPCL
jgi:hypothetical protein